MKSVPAILLAISMSSCAHQEVKPPAPVLPLPGRSQLAWHDMEMNAFVHFTTNTFTGKEWGYGDESPAIFNPDGFDAEQWVRTFQETGFKGVILTCKHHDGFCLWPSAYTNHSVKASPWRQGKGDVVKEVAQACKKYGLSFGIYVSPWDRNHADYGTPAYVAYYRNQLTELFSKYGPIFEMWFDGANGGDGYYGGKREKRSIQGSTYYDWPTTLDLVRSHEPSILFFSDAGPGVRWVGNERGVAGETNWNTISPDTLFAGKGGIEQLLNQGSETGTAWIPAEVDVSIRPGWFYHPEEDSLVKTPQQLMDIYLTSVGRGSTLLLNVPPNRHGLLQDQDIRSLKGFRELLNKSFAYNRAKDATVEVSSIRGKESAFAANNLTDGNPDTYWATDDGITSGEIKLSFPESKIIHYVVLQEYITLGQRVKSFDIILGTGSSSQRVYSGTTVGHKRIIQLEPTPAGEITIRFKDARGSLVISNLEVY